MKKIAMLTATAVVVIAGTAVAMNDGGLRAIREVLTGYEEVATVSTTGRGTFRAALNSDRTEIAFKLQYSGIEGTTQQAHIHFGARGTNGGISAFLCTNLGNGPAGTQPCPQEGTVEGVIDAQDVIGPASQGIEAGAWEELLAAMRAGKTYVNVHSTKWPGGEIRSQIETGHRH
jgi:hypothetical protein